MDNKYLQYADLDDETKNKFVEIFNDVIQMILSHDAIIYGGCVRDYLLRKEIPKDIDVAHVTVDSFTKKLISALHFSFDIVNEEMKGMTYGCKKLTLKHKHINLPPIEIDVCKSSIVGSRLDMDVNGFIFSKNGSIKFSGDDNLKHFTTVYPNVMNKQFTILRKYTRPAEPRRLINNRKIHSLLLIEYFKIFLRCMKMINRGWVTKQNLKDIFFPFIFVQTEKEHSYRSKLLSPSTSSVVLNYPNECIICCCAYDIYHVETQCCHQKVCVTCSFNHIVSHINDETINCMFCVSGDMYGWGTTPQSNMDLNYPMIKDIETNSFLK